MSDYQIYIKVAPLLPTMCRIRKLDFYQQWTEKLKRRLGRQKGSLPF